MDGRRGPCRDRAICLAFEGLGLVPTHTDNTVWKARGHYALGTSSFLQSNTNNIDNRPGRALSNFAYRSPAC